MNAVAGAVGGLLLMRFTDNLGAIAIIAMPLMAIPLLLAAAFVDAGHAGFLALFALIALFLIGGRAMPVTASPSPETVANRRAGSGDRASVLMPSL